MPNYLRDPDIRAVIESGFEIPPGLEPSEADRLREFLRWDQEMEQFDRAHPGARAPETLLRALATAAMAAYDQRSDRLSRGWQKLLVLRAGIAGYSENLDDFKIEDWAYTRITEENPDWIVPWDEGSENEPPLNWLRHVLALEVLRIRQFRQEEKEGKVGPGTVGASASGCLIATLGVVAIVGMLLSRQ